MSKGRGYGIIVCTIIANSICTLVKKMRIILFRIHFRGMSLKCFSRKILIDKPFKTICYKVSPRKCNRKQIRTVSDLIDYIKRKDQKTQCLMGEFGAQYFNYSNIYVEHKGYLFGLKSDKELEDIFTQLGKRIVIFDFFYVAGGGSREYHGYRFSVHSDESIHEYLPHVHVERDGVATRYSLSTYERFKDDKCTRAHLRDEKKIIIPYIKKNHKWFMEKWNLSKNGFVPPVETLDGKQICLES